MNFTYFARTPRPTPMPLKNRTNANRFAIVTTLAFFAYTGAVYVPQGKCFALEGGVKSLGLLFSYGAEEVQSFLTARSSDQIQCYLQFLMTWDAIFALGYGLMYGSWIYVLFPRHRWMGWVPVGLAVLLDVAENFTEISCIQHHLRHGELLESLIYRSSMLNSAKWISTGLVFTTLLFGVLRKMKTRKHHP